MKLLKYIGITILVLFLLLVAGVCGLWLHNNNYSGTITEFRDLGNPPVGVVFSLDGKYPKEQMLLYIDGPDVKKFLYSDGRDLLPRENDYVHIKGFIHRYTGRDGIDHRKITITDPSQIVIDRPATK